MGLNLEVFETPVPPKRGRNRWEEIVRRLDDDSQLAELAAAIEADIEIGYSSITIADRVSTAIEPLGLSVSETTVQKWMKKRPWLA